MKDHIEPAKNTNDPPFRQTRNLILIMYKFYYKTVLKSNDNYSGQLFRLNLQRLVSAAFPQTVFTGNAKTFVIK